LIESKWSALKRHFIHSLRTRLSRRRLSRNSAASILPTCKLSNKKCRLHPHQKSSHKEILKNLILTHCMMNIIQFTLRQWNGSRPWVKFQGLNKSRLTTSTSALPEDMLWLSGVDFYFSDLWEQPKIFSCLHSHRPKLGVSCSLICISTLKEKNIF